MTIFACRNNLSQRLLTLADTVRGYEYELHHAANQLDDAVGAYCMDRESSTNMARLLISWGEAHRVYLEAGGKALQVD